VRFAASAATGAAMLGGWRDSSTGRATGFEPVGSGFESRSRCHQVPLDLRGDGRKVSGRAGAGHASLALVSDRARDTAMTASEIRPPGRPDKPLSAWADVPFWERSWIIRHFQDRGACWLYVICRLNDDANSEPSKIGIANNPRARIATFQTAAPFRLSLFGAVLMPRHNASICERLIHEHMQADRLHGEWFSVHPGLALHFAVRVVALAMAEANGVGSETLARAWQGQATADIDRCWEAARAHVWCEELHGSFRG
jgi:T5orf172 domain